MVFDRISQVLDTVEREALRKPATTKDARRKLHTVQKWLAEVVAFPVDWRERVAAVPAAQGLDYALALAGAAMGKRLRLEDPPVAVRRDIPPAFVDPFSGLPDGRLL